VDTSRETPATQAGPRRPSRTLVTTLWYPASGAASALDQPDAPAAAGPFPLVVWAHGFNRVGAEYHSLLHRWAAAGYVIAAPSLPSSRRPGPGMGPASSADQRAEPGDLDFVLRQLTEPGGPVGALRGVVAGGPVIAAGHSQGAADALALGLAACCRDARVTAVVSIAGVELPSLFGPFSAGDGRVSTLFEQGDRDVHLAVGGARTMYARTNAPKVLLVLRGADHNTSLLDVADPAAHLLADVVVAFSNHVAKGVAFGADVETEVAGAGFAELAHEN
jgi:dienelactone hydrolase